MIKVGKNISQEKIASHFLSALSIMKKQLLIPALTGQAASLRKNDIKIK